VYFVDSGDAVVGEILGGLRSPGIFFGTRLDSADSAGRTFVGGNGALEKATREARAAAKTGQHQALRAAGGRTWVFCSRDVEAAGVGTMDPGGMVQAAAGALGAGRSLARGKCGPALSAAAPEALSRVGDAENAVPIHALRAGGRACRSWGRVERSE